MVRVGFTSLLVGVAGIAVAPWFAPSQDGVHWHRDLDAARELAERDGRPLLVVFR